MAAPSAPAVAAEPDSGEISVIPRDVPRLQITNDFVSPAMAFSGYYPLSQLESRGVKVGPTTVRASVNAGVGYNDNVTLSSTNKVSSMFVALAPSFAVGLEGATQRYYAVYRGNYGWHARGTADDYDDHNFGLTALNDWTGRLRTSARYEFNRGHDPRGATATSSAAPDLWNLHALRGTVSYGAPGALAQIDGNLGYVKREYTTNRDVTRSRDYDQFDAGATFFYRIAPKTRVSLQITHSEIEHETDASQDATENGYLVGATWEALAKTQGRVAIGYMTRDAESSAISRFSAPMYEAGVTWSPLTYSSVSAVARRTFAAALEPGSNFIVLSVASVTWNHIWLDRFQSTVGYLYGLQDHQGLGRTDRYQTFDAKVSYPLQRRLWLGAQFRHDRRGSPDPTFEYKRNLTLFTIESAL